MKIEKTVKNTEVQTFIYKGLIGKVLSDEDTYELYAVLNGVYSDNFNSRQEAIDDVIAKYESSNT